MTLNNLLSRVRSIALSHNQVRNFYKGLIGDFLVDHTTLYPSVFLQDNGGVISTARAAATLNYRMFIVDLVNVAADTKANENDVHSDMISIALDIITQMNFYANESQDWKISTDNNLQLVVESGDDMYAGVVIDFSVSFMFKQDRCQIPSDLIIEDILNTDKKMYDLVYIATGAEGSTLTTTGIGAHIPMVNGKKILAIAREGTVIYKVSNLPDSLQYTWNDTSVGLGAAANPGERFLILYRNY